MADSPKRVKTIPERVFHTPYDVPKSERKPVLHLVRQDYEKLEINKSVVKTPMIIGAREFKHGMGTHSISHIKVYSPEPITHFSAWVGVNAPTSNGGNGLVDFTVRADGKTLYKTGVLKGLQEAEKIDIDVNNVNTLDLLVGNGDDGPSWDHANWADAVITTQGGKTLYLDEIEQGVVPAIISAYPFSFTYGGKLSDDLLPGWTSKSSTQKIDADRTKLTTVWTDPQTGLKLTWEAVKYSDYPAVEWLLYMENTGKADTPIISGLQALDISINTPMSGPQGYRLHRTKGAPSDPTDFEVNVVPVDSRQSEVLSAGGGRSSNKDFPFFKVETGEGSIIVAVGWSGQWLSRLDCPDGKNLRITAGLEKTHFLLHPGEKIRSPRMLVMHWQGDTLESNAQFRQLIYKHYSAKRNGEAQLPTPFCNTCFTRGGGWLNECNAENQISLIKAYAKLGLEALMTDAGWFTGGWPSGAGNWDARKDAYPEGMGPVAQAAKDNGMIYGLWYEPERVVADTTAHREHPDWCLASGDGPQGTYLLNFGLKDVQQYFFDIVKGYMELPGFRVYRQDFNMDPLPYWLYNDAEDRQGMTEMKYIEGLYAYWDMIRNTWPDAFMEECASGGRRIDLETITRMNAHQDSDYWFDYDVDQAQTWGVSQYLPNNLIVQHLHVLDEYSFHATMASSLCLGWIADAPDFDSKKGKELLGRYREVRHLMIGAWYPLLPYSRDSKVWMASQYHRPDLNEGLIIALRHAECPYSTVQVSLHGLDKDATYELRFDSMGKKTKVKGFALMNQYELRIPDKRKSDLITYRKLDK
ncbi:MAG: NPCBM/NEW2 domain-containing protein [Armatimonadota bacterium]